MGTGATAFGAEIIDLQPGSATYLVGALIKRDRYKTLANSWTIDDSLDELQRLCETAGLEVLGREYQSMQNPSPSTFIGPGKLDEVAAKCKALRVKTLVFDDELSPAQGRNIAEALGDGAQVIDRTMLILFIFAQRARTREAKLQVAAAQYKYMLPRLTTFLSVGAGLDAKGGAVSGGGGQYLKGSGESQLEVDRRLFRKQLSRIEEQINEVQMQRDAYREKRKQRDMLPVVAIVGYTNAGKSTLLNALVGSKEVYADDLLFATLDPTTRKLCLPGGREVLISDTVGFIQKLPTKLVASFRATLDELQDAALVVHVVDASSPLASQQVKSVQGIIHDLDAHKTPQILVLNKADAVAADPEASQRARSTSWESLHEALTPSHVVATSAADGRGLDKLKAALEAALLALSSKIQCVLPYSESALLAEAHKAGTIESEEYVEDGTRLVAYVPPSLRNRVQRACELAGTEFVIEGEAAAAAGGGGVDAVEEEDAAAPLKRKRRAAAEVQMNEEAAAADDEEEVTTSSLRRKRKPQRRRTSGDVQMKGSGPAVTNEFPRPISVASLKRKATRNELTATPEECAALASRFDLAGIGSLAANVSLAVVDPRRTRVRAYGTFRASAVEPRAAGAAAAEALQVDAAPFETFFVDEELLIGGGAYDSDADDAYDEPIEDGSIDMGELVAQHLYLWLSEQEQQELRSADGETDYKPGEVVFDTDGD